MWTDKYFSNVEIKFGTIFASDIFPLDFISIEKISIEINLSKGEPNSEFEPEILTNPRIVVNNYRTVHFYSDGHQSCAVRLGDIQKLGLARFQNH